MDYPRRGIDEDVIIAWADASARLAAELRRTHDTAPRPELTLCPQPVRCHHAAAAVAVAAAMLYYPYARFFHCACQWHLAIEIHPLFLVRHWAVAAGASIAWQAYDRLKPVTRGDPPMAAAARPHSPAA